MNDLLAPKVNGQCIKLDKFNQKLWVDVTLCSHA